LWVVLWELEGCADVLVLPLLRKALEKRPGAGCWSCESAADILLYGCCAQFLPPVCLKRPPGSGSRHENARCRWRGVGGVAMRPGELAVKGNGCDATGDDEK
jgi:hypothetical protein